MRRVHGRDHRCTLAASANLAASLSSQGKYAEAVEIERGVLVQKTRPLGADHEDTLISATNLAVSLSNCDQATEAGQLLRQTLILSRRALGPNHEQTQHVFFKSGARSADATDERDGWVPGLSRWATSRSLH